ncbi:reverse transcriptase domain-containing protein [Tanacetum coccineum]
MFVNQFFPPSRTTNLRNEITRFQQRFGETFSEAWDRFKDLLNKCPYHGFSPLHQIDTFYNGLSQSDQDSLNSAVGGNLLTRNTQEALTIIENKSKGALPSNTQPNPREQVNSITTRSGLTNVEPSIPPPVPLTPRVEVEKEPKTLMDEVHITSPASTAHVPPPGIQTVLMDALTQIPKYHKVLKDLLKDKEKLEELANTSINVECFAILLNKVPEKLEDPGKFLIPFLLQDLEVCNSLADSVASINLMPLSIYEKLRIGPLKPTRMTLELANRSVTFPMGIAEDVIVKVEKFNFLADFVIVDFEADPRVPIILGRPFLRMQNLFLTPFETSDSLLEEFADELALIDLFPPGNKDDNFDLEADLREIEYLLNRYPSTDSSPTTDIDIIDPILESFNNTHSKKDKNKDSKAKSLIDEIATPESNDLLPWLLDCDSTLHEEFPKIDTLPSFPPGDKDKLFKPGILVYGSTYFVTNKVTQDKNLKEKTSSKELLILEDSNFLPLSSDCELFFHLELSSDEDFSILLFLPQGQRNSERVKLEIRTKIPSDESKVHIEVLSVLWGNRLRIPDGSLPLSRYKGLKTKQKRFEARFEDWRLAQAMERGS